MPVTLTEAKNRDRAAKNRSAATKNPTRADFRMTPVEVADQIARAIASVPACRAAGMVAKRESGDVGPVRYSGKLRKKSSDEAARVAVPLTAEGQALAAMIGETLWKKRGPLADAGAILAERRWLPRSSAGSPAEVLRFIRRAELALAVAEKLPASDGIPRSLTGRKYLTAVAESFMRDSRDWRDSAESYRTRSAADGTGPMVESYDQYGSADYLTLAQARETERRTGEPLPALPLHSARVSDALAAAIAPMRELVNVSTALRAAEAPLASVALAEGISLPLAKKRSAAGASWLRGCDRESGPKLTKDQRESGEPFCPGCGRAAHSARVSAAALVDALRAAADQTGDVIPADDRAPMLPAFSGTYSAAVDATIAQARKLATASASPLPGRVDGASSRDLRLIAGHVERGNVQPRERGPMAPFPALTAWRIAARRDGRCD